MFYHNDFSVVIQQGKMFNKEWFHVPTVGDLKSSLSNIFVPKSIQSGRGMWRFFEFIKMNKYLFCTDVLSLEWAKKEFRILHAVREI